MAVIEGVAVLRKMIQMRITYERFFVTRSGAESSGHVQVLYLKKTLRF